MESTVTPPSQPQTSLDGEPRRLVSHALPERATQKLRIAYLVSQYPALSHTFIKKEVEALEADGHEVFLASVRLPSNLGILGDEGNKDRDRTFYLLPSLLRCLPGALVGAIRHRANLKCMASTWFRVFLKKPFSPSTYAYALESLVLLDWMLKNDLRHVHNHFGNAAATVALIASASHLVHYSLSIHGPDIFYNTDDELLPLKLSSCRFARSISHYCSSQLSLLTEGHHWSRFEIVRCGIDPATFTPRPEPANEIPALLCVGRLVPAKGQRILLAASQRLRDQGTKHTLTFVGTGPDQTPLAEHAEHAGMDHVRFTGGLDPAGVKSEYSKADLFILPSFAEGVPVVLMEAMASGVPVISTRITGIPELIESGKEGLLVPPSDVDSLVEAIRRLLGDPGLCRSMSEEGRRKVLDLYNLNVNGPEMGRLFEKYL